MTDEDYEHLHAKFISKGFTEDQYASFILMLEKVKVQISIMYQFCNLHTSKLFSLVELQPNHNVTPNLEAKAIIEFKVPETNTLESSVGYGV